MDFKNILANESMFDAEMTAGKLLDEVKVNVAEKVTTVDEAARLENKLSEEAIKFNNCLTSISNAIRKAESGEISREEMLAEVTPCVSELKEKCIALSLSGVDTPGDDITEDEISMLREYIVGCKDIVAKRKEELQNTGAASESSIFAGVGYSIATEANKFKKGIAKQIRYSTEAKTANQLYKSARSLYSNGSKEQAYKYLDKAKKLYQSCLDKTKKNADMFEAERTETSKNPTHEISDKYTQSVSNSSKMTSLIYYFEDRIDSCTALKMQWTNKAGNVTFKETKAALKKERSEARKAERLRKRKELAGKNAMAKAKISAKFGKHSEGVTESMGMFDVMYAAEAYADEILTAYEFESALESDGADEYDVSSENEAKLAKLYADFKEAKRNGDDAAMERINGEITVLLDKINREAQDAYTEDDLKAADRKVVKALAIGGAIAATAIVGHATGADAKIVGLIKGQTEKIRKTKGKDKNETKKGINLVKNVKDFLKSCKGKFKNRKNVSNKEGASESYIPDNFMETCESYMNKLELEIALNSATESSVGFGAACESISDLTSKIRGAFGKLKHAKSDEEIRDAQSEIKEASGDLQDAIDDAETPEEKERLSKSAKVALAAAGTAAVAVGLTVLGKHATKVAMDKNSKGYELSGLDRNLINIANKVAEAKKTASGNKNRIINSVSDTIAKNKQNKVNAKQRLGAYAAFKDEKFKNNEASESVLTSLAFGLEGCGSACDEGKAFDDDDLLEDAYEAEADAMLAEDGLYEE